MTDKIFLVKKPPTIKDFGKRLAEVRKARGLSQRDLARELGISNRMVAYYEAQTQYVPSNLLIPLSKILKVPIEELLGLKDIKEQLNPQARSLWKKLKKAELLPKKDQKSLLNHLDDLLQKVPQSQPFKIPSLHEAAQRRMKIG